MDVPKVIISNPSSFLTCRGPYSLSFFNLQIMRNSYLLPTILRLILNSKLINTFLPLIVE